jgi:hypothetical protein
MKPQPPKNTATDQDLEKITAVSYSLRLSKESGHTRREPSGRPSKVGYHRLVVIYRVGSSTQLHVWSSQGVKKRTLRRVVELGSAATAGDAQNLRLAAVRVKVRTVCTVLIIGGITTPSNSLVTCK